MMRKTLLALSVAAAAAISSQASAQDYYYGQNYVAPVAGAAVGTAVGVGLYNGWYGTNGAFWGTTWPASAAGAATTGFVAGVGTAALIHAATTPCQGFHALFGNFLTSSRGCVNGQWVGDRPVRRVVRR
jgi:hypothetical protein